MDLPCGTTSTSTPAARQNGRNGAGRFTIQTRFSPIPCLSPRRRVIFGSGENRPRCPLAFNRWTRAKPARGKNTPCHHGQPVRSACKRLKSCKSSFNPGHQKHRFCIKFRVQRSFSASGPGCSRRQRATKRKNTPGPNENNMTDIPRLRPIKVIAPAQQ